MRIAQVVRASGITLQSTLRNIHALLGAKMAGNAYG
jgi:hypothetical protein